MNISNISLNFEQNWSKNAPYSFVFAETFLSTVRAQKRKNAKNYVANGNGFFADAFVGRPVLAYKDISEDVV